MRAGPGMLDLHWARLAYAALERRAPHAAPTAKLWARFVARVGNPQLDDTGAPAPIWMVHVALMHANQIADTLGIARVAAVTLAPRRRETELAWVDRVGSMLVSWAERGVRRSARVTRNVNDSRYVIPGTIGGDSYPPWMNEVKS